MTSRFPRLGLLASIITASLAATAAPERSAPVATDQDRASQALHNGRVALFLELSGRAAAEIYAEERDRFFAANRFVMAGDEAAIRAAAESSGARLAFAAATQLREVQSTTIEALKARNAYILFNTQFATNGIAVLVEPAAVAGLRSIPGVVRVSPLAAQEQDAVSSIDFTGTRTFWGTLPPDLNLRGANIGVGVIDTGIDHMHTAFAGPGGTAYAANVTTATAYPTPPTVPVAANYPTPKVIWGFDYAGDAYNAGGTADTALLPLPDPNPMDTNGHGTAVASLIAGFGANNDGTTYTGAYNSTAPNIFADLRISPGYAPQASLYAFRVFGTAGSTQLTTAALDSATAIYLWQADTSITWNGAVTATVFNAAGQPVTVNYNIPQPPATPRLRVINLSLGSNAGDIEESSALAAQRSADAGLVVVMSAGNADDSYYITGAPGVASGGISVAASFNNQFPGGNANAPANGAQAALVNFSILNFGTASFSSTPYQLASTAAIYGAPNLADYLAPTPPGVTLADPGLTVTLKDPAGLDINLFSNDGSGNLVVSNNPAANNVYAGKLVLLDRGAVGFHQKALAAERAGAVGVLIVTSSTAAIGGMAAAPGLPVINIPSALIEQAVGAAFTDGGGLNTGVPRTVAARPGLTIALTPFNQGLQDTMAAYSSRGPRRNDDGIKPDITAPAENVSAASATTGNGSRSFNGTSSAAPHTAGAMLLLRQLNPTWSNYELKALLLNSAGNDVYTQLGTSVTTPPAGQIWGVTRQGVGRWDLSRQSGGGTKVIMFGTDPLPTSGGASRQGSINVSFGTFDVSGTASHERNVVVRNKGNTAQTFNIGLSSVTDTPGVSYSLPDGNTISVPALSERSFRVRVDATAADMRHARDLSTRPFQFIVSTAPANRVPRQFPNEESAYLTLTPSTGGPVTHRLTVQSFPRRASTLAASTPAVVLGTPATLGFTGSGFNTGTNTAFVDTATFAVQPPVVDVVSFVKGFELSYQAPPSAGLTAAAKGADLRYVGVTTDFAQRANPFDPATTGNQSTVLVFGLATHGEFDTVQSGFGTEFQIEIDSNRDGTVDRVVRQFAFTNGERTTVTSNINLPVVSTAPPFTSGTGTGWFLNAFSNVYTNTYNNDVITIPVSVSGGNGSLGLSAATAQFNYRVRAFHRGVQVSQTPFLTYNVAQPGISFTGINEPSLQVPVSTAGTAQTIAVTSNATNYAANGSAGLLMLYPMNATGARAQVIPVVEADAVFSNGFETPVP